MILQSFKFPGDAGSSEEENKDLAQFDAKELGRESNPMMQRYIDMLRSGQGIEESHLPEKKTDTERLYEYLRKTGNN